MSGAAPKVTVAIPVFNRETYVGATIESVLSQSFTDFELLVVDDASSDGSCAVVESFDDPRIRLHRQPENLGVARVRNLCLELARGEYLAFLDSDDLSHPGRLAAQVAFLDAHPDHAAVGAWSQWMDEAGRPLKRFKRKPLAAEDIAAQRLFRAGIENSTAMARTAVIRAYGHDDRYDIGEDYDLWARMAVDHKLANLPQVLVLRRTHEQATTRLVADRKQRQRQAIYAAQLERLGVAFTERDLERHFLLRRMNKLGFVPDRDYLDWGEAWLLKLQSANRSARCYPEPAFSKVLGSFWLRVCWRASRGLGWHAWRRLAGSPLRRWAGVGLWQDLALSAPQPVARLMA
ncbi:MAG: glycosyltransferase family A protein [Pseudomonadota bacterium]